MEPTPQEIWEAFEKGRLAIIEPSDLEALKRELAGKRGTGNLSSVDDPGHFLQAVYPDGSIFAMGARNHNQETMGDPMRYVYFDGASIKYYESQTHISLE